MLEILLLFVIPCSWSDKHDIMSFSLLIQGKKWNNFLYQFYYLQFGYFQLYLLTLVHWKWNFFEAQWLEGPVTTQA